MRIDKDEIWKCLSLEDLEVEIDSVLVKEVWKDIIGYEGLYQISNLGRGKALERTITYNPCQRFKVKKNKYKERIIKQCLRYGYSIISYSKNNIKKSNTVSVIVAKTFILNPLNKPCVCHKDDIGHHNWESNLWWGTPQDNRNDCVYKKRHAKGEQNGNAKLRDNDIKEIRDINLNDEALSKKYNVSKSTINYIKLGKTWKHIKH